MNSTTNRNAAILLLGAMFTGCSQNSGFRPSPDFAITGVDTSVASAGAESPKAGSQSPDPAHDITLDDVQQHVRNGSAIIIDARGPQRFAEGHVRGAINIPAGEHMEAYRQQYLQDVDPQQLVIIYCSSPTCHASDMVYEYLIGFGFTNMRVFSDGWVALASDNGLR